MKTKRRRLSKRGLITIKIIFVIFFLIVSSIFFSKNTIKCRDNELHIFMYSKIYEPLNKITYEVSVQKELAKEIFMKKEQEKQEEQEKQKRIEEEKQKQVYESEYHEETLSYSNTSSIVLYESYEEAYENLAHLCYAEARGEGTEAMIGCCAVVLNRIESPLFQGKTTHEIIFATNQFAVVDDGQIYYTPSDEAYKAAEIALSGYDPTNGSLFFTDNSVMLDESYAIPNDIEIANMIFYYSVYQNDIY